MRLDGKVALISGGARGMGAAEARLFASEGAKVVVGDVLEDEGRRTEARIAESGGEALFVPLDVTSEDDWNRAVSAAVERFGKLDILVNNAGVWNGDSVEFGKRGELGSRYGHQRQGRVPRHEGGNPRYARGGRRLHRQHIVRSRHHRQSRGNVVQRIQGRGADTHQVNRRSGRG